MSCVHYKRPSSYEKAGPSRNPFLRYWEVGATCSDAENPQHLRPEAVGRNLPSNFVANSARLQLEQIEKFAPLNWRRPRSCEVAEKFLISGRRLQIPELRVLFRRRKARKAFRRLKRNPPGEMRPILVLRKVAGCSISWKLGRFLTLSQPSRPVLVTGPVRDLRK